MAGESAEELARRQRDKAGRLLRSAELWQRGAEGERRTGAVLDGLATYGYVAVHDILWPGRERANIDHVLVGPSGVYAIDSKNWSGRIVVSQGTVMQDRRRRDSALVSCGEAARALTDVLGTEVSPVVCFVRDEDLSGIAQGVSVCTTANLQRLVLSKPTKLSVEQIQSVAERLRSGVTPARADRAQASRRNPPTITSRRRPRTRRGVRRRKLLRAGCFAVVGLALLAAAPWLAQEVPKHFVGTFGSDAPTLTFGTPHDLVDSEAKVRVKVTRPIAAEPARGAAKVKQGMRLLSVKVTMRNTGGGVWRPPYPVRFSGEDSTGNQVSLWPSAAVVAGQRFPQVKALWPRKPIGGVLVFEVPRMVDLEAVSMSTEVVGGPAVTWAK